MIRQEREEIKGLKDVRKRGRQHNKRRRERDKRKEGRETEIER